MDAVILLQLQSDQLGAVRRRSCNPVPHIVLLYDLLRSPIGVIVPAFTSVGNKEITTNKSSNLLQHTHLGILTTKSAKRNLFFTGHLLVGAKLFTGSSANNGNAIGHIGL